MLPMQTIKAKTSVTNVRGLSPEIRADLARMAGERGTSSNAVMLELIQKGVEAWRKDEKKRLQKRLDELNQGTLV